MENTELKANLRAFAQGDRMAFTRIYQELSTPVLTIIYRMTQDRQLSEDIMQEVFLKIYQSPVQETIEKPRAWIFKIAHNLTIDSMRKRHFHEDVDAVEDTLPSYQEDVILKMDVESAMRKLHEMDRNIVSLHLNAGLKFREIAEIVKLPLGTVLRRYHTAIKYLRAWIDEKE